jgi:hypothetical protein
MSEQPYHRFVYPPCPACEGEVFIDFGEYDLVCYDCDQGWTWASLGIPNPYHEVAHGASVEILNDLVAVALHRKAERATKAAFEAALAALSVERDLSGRVPRDDLEGDQRGDPAEPDPGRSQVGGVSERVDVPYPSEQTLDVRIPGSPRDQEINRSDTSVGNVEGTAPDLHGIEAGDRDSDNRADRVVGRTGRSARQWLPNRGVSD